MVHPTMHNLLVIDATKPVDRAFPVRVKIPEEVLKRVRIEDFLE
jgi:hypothetical protein